MSGCKIGCGVIAIVFFGMLILYAISIASRVCGPSCKGCQMCSCIANLKQLEGAREQAIIAGKTNPCMADLCGATAYLTVTPVCPASKVAYPMPALGATFLCPNPGITGDPDYTHSLYK
jgi:hypothetical protein